MNRDGAAVANPTPRVPRASGDEPVPGSADVHAQPVFPARAGMNRIMQNTNDPGFRVPRASGDEPCLRLSESTEPQCSPRERG